MSLETILKSFPETTEQDIFKNKPFVYANKSKQEDIDEYVRVQSNLSRNIASLDNTRIKALLDPRNRYAFVDNTEYIRFTVHKSLNGSCKFIRPRRFGKTTFGFLWLEFFKGNKDLFQGLKILDFMEIPLPGEFIGVSVSFGTDVNGVLQKLTRSFNKGFRESGLETIEENKTSITSIITQVNKILRIHKRKVALFVDEYDLLIRKASPEQYTEAVRLTELFYMELKEAKNIPTVLITGSTNIAFSGMWSNGNDTTDLSMNSLMDSALGYTWDDIVRVYSVQLQMLSKLHNLTFDELKIRIEKTYGGYLFFPNSTKKLFNPVVINSLMSKGEFLPYFTMTSASSSLRDLTRLKTISEKILDKFLHEHYIMSVTFSDVITWRYEPGSIRTEFDVVMIMVSTGLLTYSKILDVIYVKISNDDALYFMINILKSIIKEMNV